MTQQTPAAPAYAEACVHTPVPLIEDDISRQLRSIWQQTLGIESIGLDQNYFDLGGDSSLAVQMFARMEDVFKVKLPLATLYEAPTIQELAAVLRGKASESRWSPLVEIQSSGSRPAFFCMHGAGGNVLNYRELSKHLGPDQPFYGLQCLGLDGSCAPLTRIEDMAVLYVNEIRRVQPHGPYFLGLLYGGHGGVRSGAAARGGRRAGSSARLVRHHELAQDPAEYLDQGITCISAVGLSRGWLPESRFVRKGRVSA